MALNVTKLETDIKKAFDDESDKEIAPAVARANQAIALAKAIEAFVKSGTVKVTSLTAMAGNIPVTGISTGDIS